MKKLLFAALLGLCYSASAQTLNVDFIATSPTTICEGDTIWVTDISTTTGGSGVYSRLWDNSGGMIIGDDTAPSTYMVAVSGTGGIDFEEVMVYLAIQDSTGAFDEEFKFDFCHVDRPPLALTANATNTSICMGDTVQLLSGTAGDWMIDSWSWSPSAEISSDTSQNPYCWATNSTNYTVTATNGVCSEEANVIITVNPLPTAPIITQVGQDLQSDYAAGNQWYMNSSILSGEIYQTLTPTASGDYTVTVTDINGCVAESLPFSFTYLSVGENHAVKPLSVYPNPAIDIVNISTSVDGNVMLLNNSGKVLEVYPTGTNSINMESFSTGLYFIIIKEGNTSYVSKITKM